MRFCFLTTFFPPLYFGGDAIFVANLANALAALGHDVHVVHCADSFHLLNGAVPPSQFALHPKVAVHTLHHPLGPLSPLITYFTGGPGIKAGRLESILAADFDVVHWHNLSLIAGPAGLRYGKGVRLCTLHDYWFICPAHILFKNGEAACDKPECFRCVLKHRRLPQPWRYGSLMKDSLAHIDRFLAPSAFVRDRYRASALGIQATVLPHFIPDRRPPPATPPGEPYYVYVGRLEKAKGLQTVLPLFLRGGRTLKVAGSGDFEPQLRRQAAGSSNVRFLGRVPHGELAALYADARATLIPSICYETFGLTALESLQQRTPVVASSYGALPEVIEETGGGVVYHGLEELEALLRRMDSDPEFGRRLGETGSQRLQKYSLDAHLQTYLDLIENIRSEKQSLMRRAATAVAES